MKISLDATRRIALAVIGAAGAAGAFAQSDPAVANYPQKVVKIVVPYSPGSGTDLLARILAERLGPRLGQAVIVENKAGASGLIGTQLVANSPADGYTLMVAPPTHIITSVLRKTPYDPIKNFEPVSQLARSSVLVVTHPSTPAKSLKEMVGYLKAQGDNATYSSAGIGSTLHLYTALFQQVVGTSMRHVPGKGVPGATMDVVQNSVTMALVPIENASPLFKAGRLKVFAQTGKQRSPQLPDVPTVAEAGVPNFDVELWYGLFVPAGTPKSIIARLNREVVSIMAMPEVQNLVATSGADIVTSTPEQLGNRLKEEHATWSELVSRTGIKAE
jgi:tripartite-type tricarboxylate transporter receptor subunit TctC